MHKLISDQYKNYFLDLMTIWSKQEVPAVLTDVLKILTEQTFNKITDSSRATINVTQWCKREDCWRSVKEINIQLPKSIETILIEKSKMKAAEKSAKADQKLMSGTEAQINILKYSAQQWQSVLDFAKSKHLISQDEETILKIARQIPSKLPSAYQSHRLLMVLERVICEGFQL